MRSRGPRRHLAGPRISSHFPARTFSAIQHIDPALRIRRFHLCAERNTTTSPCQWSFDVLGLILKVEPGLTLSTEEAREQLINPS